MKEFQINTFDDLLEFIQLDEVTLEQAEKVVCTVLRVCIFDYESKEQFYNDVENFINRYCREDKTERPIFLYPVTDFDEMMQAPEFKKIVDKIEKEY